MAAHGGLITAADLARYHAVERAPLHGSYRGYEIVTMPPPSSGGIALLQMLGMLEPHDVAALGLNSAAKIHLFAEVMRRAFQDRAQFLGDPDFVKVPCPACWMNITSSSAWRISIPRTPRRTPVSPSAILPQPASPCVRRPIRPWLTIHRHDPAIHHRCCGQRGEHHLHAQRIVGQRRDGAKGRRAVDNEMDDFAAKVGVPNGYGLVQGEANAIAPGKRPLSSMTPTIVLKDGKPFLVTGSPGGPTIINTVLLVITNIIDHRLSVTQAVDAPRFHHQWLPDAITHEPFFTSPTASRCSRGRDTRCRFGHCIRTLPKRARLRGRRGNILIDPRTGLRLGANDWRSPDSAAVGW